MSKTKPKNVRIECVNHKDKGKGKSLKTQKFKTNYGSKTSGEGFVGERKNAMVHQYKRLVRKEQRQQAKSVSRVQSIYAESGHTAAKHRKGAQKVSSFHKEELKWKKQKHEKEKKRKELQEKQEEKVKALKKYKEKKKLVHKKLSKKNYKGQPNMAAQMEVLLQKIERSQT